MMVWFRVESTGSVQGEVAGCCEQGDEPSGSVKFWEFYWLRGYLASKNDFAPKS